VGKGNLTDREVPVPKNEFYYRREDAKNVVMTDDPCPKCKTGRLVNYDWYG